MNRLQQRKFSGKLTHDVIQASFSAGETEIVETSLLILSNLGTKKRAPSESNIFKKMAMSAIPVEYYFSPKWV